MDPNNNTTPPDSNMPPATPPAADPAIPAAPADMPMPPSPQPTVPSLSDPAASPVSPVDWSVPPSAPISEPHSEPAPEPFPAPAALPIPSSPTNFPSWQTPAAPAPVAPTDLSSWQTPPAADLSSAPSDLTSPTVPDIESPNNPPSGAPSGFSITDLAGAPSTPPLSEPAAPINPMSNSSPGPESAPANPFMSSQETTAPEVIPVTPPVESMPSPDAAGIVESAPTDLSHLVGSSPVGETITPQTIPQPETLVVSPTPVSQDAQVVASSASHGFPKWVLVAGGLILLLVILGSAYFILGVGKPEQPTTSIPAEQQLTNPPQALLPTAVPTQVPASGSAGAASFGGLGGNASTSSAQTNGGNSALELLRQRQGSTTP